MSISKLTLTLATILLLVAVTLTKRLSARTFAATHQVIDFQLDIQALGPDGSPFTGEADISLKQDRSGEGLYGWGPWRVTFTGSGTVIESLGVPRQIDETHATLVTIKPVDTAKGVSTYQAGGFYATASEGRRAIASGKFRPADASGTSTLVLRNISILDAPEYAKIKLYGATPATPLELRLTGAIALPSLGPFTTLDVLSEDLMSIHSWVDNLSCWFAVDFPGEDSPYIDYIFNGSSKEVDIGGYGTIRANFPARISPSHRGFFVIPASEYTPPTPIEKSNKVLARYRLDRHFAKFRAPWDNDLSAFRTRRLSPGTYIVQNWDESGFRSNPIAPSFSGSVAVTAGQETVISLP